MNHQKSQALDAIDRNRELLCRVSDQLWEHPEVGFHEKYAAELYCATLEALGGIWRGFPPRFPAPMETTAR